MTTDDPSREPADLADEDADSGDETPEQSPRDRTDDVAVDGTPDEADEAAVADEPAAAHKKKGKRHLPIWQETALLLGIALVLAIVIKAAFVQAFYIPSESMEPGLVKNDRILVQKVSYWFGGQPQRGDVVVFEDPGNWLGANVDAGPSSPVAKALSKVGLYPSGGHLVKRVIGVEGDVITCCDADGRISVNGKALEEGDYVNDVEGLQCNGPMTGNCEWEAGPVPKGSIFVMGDNRGASADSTVHLCLDNETDCTDNPYVSDDLVVGKVFALVWPADHFTWIKRPADFDAIPDPAGTS